MTTVSFLLHKCGHGCLRQAGGKRITVNSSKFVCYACRDLPGVELCRSCKVRGEWLDRQKEPSFRNTHPRA